MYLLCAIAYKKMGNIKSAIDIVIIVFNFNSLLKRHKTFQNIMMHSYTGENYK